MSFSVLNAMTFLASRIVNIDVQGHKDGNDARTVRDVSPTAKFQDALVKHRKAAQRHLNLTKEDDNYCTTSDDDDDADDKDVFKTLVKSFNLPSGTLCAVLF